jgi:NitT/TauT family transport system substrate-binding protein
MRQRPGEGSAKMFTKAGCTKAAIIFVILLLLTGGILYYLMTRKPPQPVPEPPSSYEDQVRIGVTKRTVNLPFYALNSLLKGKGYEVVIVPFTDLSTAWERLGAGSLDIIVAPLDGVTLGVIRHRPGSIIFRVARSTGSDAIVARKEISSLADLSGKKVAVVPDSSGYLLFSILEDRVGKTVQDSDIVYADSQEQALAQLLEGRVDAAVLSDPHIQEALDKKFRIVASTASSPLIEDYCVVSRKMKETYPDRVRDVVKAWFEILEILQKNPGIGKQLISKNAGIEPAKVDQLMGRIRFSGLNENKELSEREVLKKMATFQKFWSLEGETNAQLPADFKNVLDFSFIKELNPEDIQSVYTDDTPSASPPPLPLTTAVPTPTPTKVVLPTVAPLSPSPSGTDGVPVE